MIICFIFGWITMVLCFYKNQTSFFLGLFFLILTNILIVIYDIYGKKILGSDFIFAAAETLFFLFGAFITLKNGAFFIFTWVGVVLIFTQMLYENAVSGGLKDADHDYFKNVNNLATKFGVKVTQDKKLIIPLRFKAFGIGIHLFSAPFVFIPFLFYEIPYEPWQILLLILFVLLALFLNFIMLSITQFNRRKLRRLIVMHLFVRYSIVPIMLFSIIGYFYMGILILFPLLWYVFFSFIMSEKLFEPKI